MADIPGDSGEGLDIRRLISGADIVGIYPSGLFAGSFALTNVGSVVISGTSIPKWRGVGSVMISGTLPKWIGAGSVVISGAQPRWTGVGSVMISGVPSRWSGTGSVVISGGTVSISNIYAGSKTWQIDTIPISADRTNPAWSILWNPYSGTSIGLGSNIGSVIQFIGAGSYINKFVYDASNNLSTIGSWA